MTLLVRKYPLLLCLSLLCVGWVCQSHQAPLVNKILTGKDGLVDSLLSQPEKYRLQILYTRIIRDPNGEVTFEIHPFPADQSSYFYPASTVKFPAAVLALEKLNKLGLEGLTRNTPMLSDSAFPGQTIVSQDTTSESGLPSIGHYIRKIFLVSDNDAFNRLYEFIGQGPFNERLHELGYAGTRITHRLSIAMSPEQNAHTNPIRFMNGEQLVYAQAPAFNPVSYADSVPLLLGKAQISGGKRLEGPKDFSSKNAFPLEDQQRMLRAIFFPESLPKDQQFNLGKDDWAFLKNVMAELPRESQFPAYDPEKFYDGYGKFFMYGDGKERIPDHIRIYNKIGAAYGFLTDNAYIVDSKNGVEFMLSASIFVNENLTFNDDQYEYDALGFPFLAKIGRIFYEHELEMKRRGD